MMPLGMYPDFDLPAEDVMVKRGRPAGPCLASETIPHENPDSQN
ncbi:hypothetical protein V1282_003842 [Nitrobacteraceae bacterium AZCC 2146]